MGKRQPAERTGELRLRVPCRRRCWPGMRGTSASCPGGATAMPTGCGSRKSCCSRRAWQRCWSTTARFWRRFPTVQALARAPEEQVLARWSGLGYYRRARMLHQAARVVVKESGGVIPRTVAELRKLPGSRALHGCGHCEHRLRRARGGGGWQCGAGVEPAGRRTARGRLGLAAGAGTAGRLHAGGGTPGIGRRRLEPGDDGAGSDGLHAAESAVPGVSAASLVPRSWGCDGPPKGRAQTGAHDAGADRAQALRLPGTAAGGCGEDGRDVGAAGVRGAGQRSRQTEDCASCGIRLPTPITRCGWCGWGLPALSAEDEKSGTLGGAG